MGYPHFSRDCVDFHDKVVDWGGQRPKGVVTLCGSTRFMDAFLSEQRRLTLEGYIVISVGLFGHMENDTYVPGAVDLGTDEQPSETKLMLDSLHFRKIDLADGIHVINVGGYIGSSTRNEMHYANWRGKAITLLDPAETIDFRLFEHDYSNPDSRTCAFFGCGAMRSQVL